MMSKPTAQGSNQKYCLNLKFTKAIGEDQWGIIMIKVNININTYYIGECHLEVELSTEKIIEKGHNMITIVEVTLGKEILEECKIIEVKISELDIQVPIEMKIMEQIEVVLEKDSIQVILEEMIKVVVDQDQV